MRTLKRGQRYLESWPMQAKLGSIFPENRVIRAVRFAQKAMPAVAVLTVVWQQITLPSSQMALAAAVLTALFALSIPLQGLWWLGKRSAQPLPDSTQQAYQKIVKQLAAHTQYQAVSQPTFMDLAQCLKKADKYLSADFWDTL
ncbi:terminus macrodomain insulation protein YfbV [Testudinibacter aquarius]|uniref:UPF0208 membrane protein YfbV n=1 Tax=Testudinibacter aquarius TaxID=1524974 RepID=A0A4R3Y5K6_9PAST|nr:terminus macrodomain insulation protein YfbV [Testudinibacter aquarius]KAE9527646.1 hypothetical protein A1D24_11040 [Testudinibacter aquarius]TCV85734.1 hypothetical protein EDC16_10841 [Testudinibacter aquarius]TNG93626.1 DUF412 family protein [Testudinibacter aquarius]